MNVSDNRVKREFCKLTHVKCFWQYRSMCLQCVSVHISHIHDPRDMNARLLENIWASTGTNIPRTTPDWGVKFCGSCLWKSAFR